MRTYARSMVCIAQGDAWHTAEVIAVLPQSESDFALWLVALVDDYSAADVSTGSQQGFQRPLTLTLDTVPVLYALYQTGTDAATAARLMRSAPSIQ